MATTESNGLMTYVDKDGNKILMYPVTKLELVDGAEDALNAKAAKSHTHDLSALINALTTGTANPADNDCIITQWANHEAADAVNQNTYVRRPMSAIWNYIKSKADSVYQAKGSYAAASHTHSAMTAATASAAGKAGFVPAPAAGAQGKFLRGDGTWQSPSNTTYSNMGGATSSAAGTAGLVPPPGAGAQGKFLRGDGTWQTPANTWRGIQNNLTSDSTTDSLSAAQGKALKTLVDGKAASSHNHDTSYYKKTEVDNKLGGYAPSTVLATDANLNNITTPGIYSCGGGNSVTNKPSGTDAIGLIVVHNATGSYYTQILTTSSNANTYRRTCLNGTWSAWTTDKYTDTNTWRGVQNNLTSTATDQSLAAAQGKALKELIDGKAASSHTHTKSQITDFPTSLPASDVSAWAKAANKPSYGWSEINDKPSTFAPSSHTHDDRYYTESEMDTKLNGKANSSHTHNYAGSSSAGGTANSVNSFTFKVQTSDPGANSTLTTNQFLIVYE